MEGLRVAELAGSAGLAPSTVRYYERVGLLSPARRATNGYRVFDESALEELAFIARAKGIGMTLEDIARLVAAWPNGECRWLQARLRRFLVERIAQVHGQLDELGAFERQLQAVLGRLAARDPGTARCGKGCGLRDRSRCHHREISVRSPGVGVFVGRGGHHHSPRPVAAGC